MYIQRSFENRSGSGVSVTSSSCISLCAVDARDDESLLSSS